MVSRAQRAPKPSGWRRALTLESDSVRRHVYQQTPPPCRKRPLSSDPSSAGALRRQHEKQTVARLAAMRETDATPWIIALTGSQRNKEWHAATGKPCSHTRARCCGRMHRHSGGLSLHNQQQERNSTFLIAAFDTDETLEPVNAVWEISCQGYLSTDRTRVLVGHV